MRKEILESLSAITEEEQTILDGKGGVEKNRYSDFDDFIVDSEKMLLKGKLIDIRPHTRFVNFPKHKHNYVEMVYMYNGETTHIVNGATILLKTGELLFLNKNATQEIMPAGYSDIAVNFMILPEFFDLVFAMMPEKNIVRDFLIGSLMDSKTDYMHFKVSDIVPIQNLIENLIWSIMNKQSNRYYMNQTTMGLIFMQLIDYTDRLSENDSYDNNLIFTVLRYIDDNYKKAQLTELAEKVNRPVPWLSRFINKKTNKSFTELLQRKRLQQAIFLLSASRLSVLDIITEVGYENASYFHRIFKEEYNMTPKKYRSNYLKVSFLE